jgi:hypothetical protein
MAMWLMKKAPPINSPVLEIQIPHTCRRSALNNTTNPNQESRIALKREIVKIGQSRKRLLVISAHWFVIA